MNVDVLTKAGIDYCRGVNRFMGKSQLYEKVLAKFLKDGAFDRIHAAYEADNWEELLLSAHEFKGMCGNIAMTSLYEAAEKLVALLRGGAYTREEVSAAYLKLAEEYHIANEAINAAMEDVSR